MYQYRLVVFVLFILIFPSINSQYCVPASTYGTQYGTFIDGVVLNDLSNTGTGSVSGSFYNDYTSKSATINPGVQNQITVTSGSYVGGMYYHGWIDYNRDQDFTDAGEYLGYIYISGAFNSKSLPFTPSESLLDEPMRLRISAAYNQSALAPCTSIAYGEIEDYTVIISGFRDIGLGISSSRDLRYFTWVDVENDGDLDVLFASNDYSNNTIELLRNNGNDAFSQSSVLTEPGVMITDLSVGDYDNDGDIDFVYSSINDFSGSEKVTNVYKNNGSGSFTLDNEGSLNLDSYSNVFGDYNNDGRLDLFGSSADINGFPVGNIYMNDREKGFVVINDMISTEIGGHSAWIDIDNDEFLDLMQSGSDYNGNRISKIYHNNEGNSFSEIDFELIYGTNVSARFDFGDYDNDGDLDLVLEDTTIKIYRNNGDLTFTEVIDDLGISGYAYAFIPKWIDMDNDGDMDVFCFRYGSPDRFHLFLNDGNNVFTEQALGEDLELYTMSFALGDYDNDNDLDLITLDNSANQLKIFRNDVATANTLPSVPTNIQSQVTNDEVVLTWNASSDNETPTASISYNVRVGTSPGAADALNPMSLIPSGKRKVNSRGNAGMNNAYFLKDLPPDVYYWSVQALDGNNKASSFSSEGSFEVLPMLEELTINYAENFGFAVGDYNNDGLLDILGNNGTTIYSNQGNFTFNSVSLQLTELSFSMYTWGDYDNDSDLDFLLIGYYPGTFVAKIYRNDGGNVFTDIDAGLEAHRYLDNIIGPQDIAWKDLDNDGDLDLAIAGIDTLHMFINEGNDSFVEIPTGIHQSGIEFSFVDFDNDMDLDLLIGGLEDDTTALYKNEGNAIFSLFENNLPDLAEYGDLNFGDYDNDSEAEILLMGKADGLNGARIYTHEGGGVFTDIEARLKGGWSIDGGFWDFDNDNYQDVLLNIEFAKKLYLNNRDGTFKDVEFEFPSVYTNGITSADMDNDGDLDILFPGKGFLFKNNMNFPEVVLASPVNLTSESVGKGIVLHWDKSPDLSIGEGASYNIRVGTSPGGIDIVSPMTVSPTDRRRLLPEIGNAQFNLGWRLDSLPVGKYFWSVQAISHSLTGGHWATEDSFSITALKPYFSSNTVCHGDTTKFIDESIASDTEITAWLWDLGDGNSSVEQHPSHIYEAPGEYSVTLTVTDSTGTSLAKTNPVYVLQKPLAAINADNVCAGNKVSITNTSNIDTLSIDSWTWDVGDGQSLFVKDPQPYGYLSTGIYEIKLLIEAQNGCSDSATHSVEVAEYPLADIVTGSNPQFCAGGEVRFSVLQNNNYSYQWKLGGGLISGADSSVYFANSNGDYKVQITNLAANCVSESNSPVSVALIPSPAPPAIQVSGDSIVCDGENVELSIDYTSGYTYQWKRFGGAVGSDTSTYFANSSGNYTVDVTNSSGCSATSANSINVVLNPIPDIPTVNINGLTEFCAGDSVILSVANNAAMTYQWYNGEAIIEDAVESVYNASVSGPHKLRIENEYGCVNETTPVSIIVNNNPETPVINLSGSNTFCKGESLTLSVIDNPDLTYSWKRDDGTIGNMNSYEASIPGNYTVEVSNIHGCSANATDTIKVIVNDLPASPIVNVNGPATFCAGGTVILSVKENTSLRYQWKNDGLNIAGATENSYSVDEKGNYYLLVEDSNGCITETDTISVKVEPVPVPPAIQYNRSTTFCDGDSLRLSIENNENYNYEWLLNGATVATDANYYNARSKGNYIVKVTNGGGCFVTSEAISITVNPVPDNPNISLSGSTTFCRGELLAMNVTAENGNSYQWYNEFGEIHGETGTRYMPANTGIYFVKVQNEWACEAFSQKTAVTVNEYPAKPVISSENYEQGGCQDEEPIILSVKNLENDINYQWIWNGNTISGAQESIYSGYFDEGEYSVEASRNNCKSLSDSIIIEYAEAPPKPEIYPEGPQVWYMACSNDSASSYRWYLNEDLIEGANEFIYVAGTQEGKFEVSIATEGICYSKSDPVWIPLGTNLKEEIWKDLRIYPNPTPGLFTLEMDNGIMGELIIDIFGETGAKVINIKFQKEMRHFKTQIDLSEQPASIYLIGLMLNEYQTTRRLIVE